MDTAYLSAIAALAGSAVGGLTSFLSSWIGLRAQLKSQLLVQDKIRRQELYRDFIEQATRSYSEALTTNSPDLSKLVAIYGLISRMRILSSPSVIEEADKIARLIAATYPEPNRTFSDLRKMVDEHAPDPLRPFSECCRAELGGLVDP